MERAHRRLGHVQEQTARPVYERVLQAVGIGAQSGARVTGVDAAPAMVALASRRVPDREFQVGGMESRLPYANACFDLVVYIYALEYTADPVNALCETTRVVRPGGRVVIVVMGPRTECEAAGYLAALAALSPPPPSGAPGPFTLSEPGGLGAAVGVCRGNHPLSHSGRSLSAAQPFSLLDNRGALERGARLLQERLLVGGILAAEQTIAVREPPESHDHVAMLLGVFRQVGE